MARSTTVKRIAAENTVIPEGVLPKGARGKVLVAALKLFADHGYEGASVRDICAAAGVYATTLYAHFPSKEHVLAEIIRLGHVEHLQRLRSALLECQPDPAEQLKAIVKAHVLSHCDYPMLGVVASSELHALGAEAAAPILALRQESESLFQDVVQRGIAKGVFTVADPVLALRAISSMGLRVPFWYDAQTMQTPENVAETFADFAISIVGAPAA